MPSPSARENALVTRLRRPPEILVAILDYLPVQELLPDSPGHPAAVRGDERSTMTALAGYRGSRAAWDAGTSTRPECASEEAMKRRRGGRRKSKRDDKLQVGQQAGGPSGQRSGQSQGSTTLFDAATEEERRKSRNVGLAGRLLRRCEAWNIRPRPGLPGSSEATPAGNESCQGSVRGHARQEYSKIYGAGAPFLPRPGEGEEPHRAAWSSRYSGTRSARPRC